MVPAPMLAGMPPPPGALGVVPQRVVDYDSFLRVRDSVSQAFCCCVWCESAFPRYLFSACFPQYQFQCANWASSDAL